MRPGDAQIGWIIENRLDEAYLLSWPGQMETYIPLHDTAGYDRARAPLGSYDWRLDQVKGTTTLHPANQVRIAFGTPALHPRRHLDFTFLYFDLRVRELVDPAWLVPSLELDDVCVPDRETADGKRRIFIANRSGLKKDAAARYQISIRDLAVARGWSLVPSSSPVAGISTNPIETGAFFERHFDASFLEVATGDELLMAATPDNAGRHRLAFSKKNGHWASIAIHGSTVSNSTQLIQANIHRATFFPNRRHYILVQHYDRAAGAWYPWSWIIPSTDFAQLARGQGVYLLFTTTLNPGHVNRWTKYRVPTSDAAQCFRQLLATASRRRAA
ncbi:MAG TPA: hypothetical protein VGD57_07985 [Candidatus Dormibacteraeota bacterium]|jgi:hypothetical protein